MKLRSKTIFLVISMLVLSLVTGSVAPLAAPAEASTATTLNGTTVETRRVGAVRGRGGVGLARASALYTVLETTSGAQVDLTASHMLVRHGRRELLVIADTRTAFLTTDVGTRRPRTARVTLTALPRTVAGIGLFVPFTDVLRHLGGRLSDARTATLTSQPPATVFEFSATATAIEDRRDVVAGGHTTGSGIRFVGRGATFPDRLYGRDVTPPAFSPPANTDPWLPAYIAASQDLSGTTPAAIGYNRINLDNTTASALTVGGTSFGEARGSGTGVDAVRLRQADFAGTDMISTVTPSVLEAFPPIPTVKGGVAVIFNLLDEQNNRVNHLNLTADVIAGIYLGQISHWDNPAIQRLNPRVDLPHNPIRVNWRPDVSGTTEIFTAYLNAASRVWRETLGDSRHAAGEPMRRLAVDMDHVVTAAAIGVSWVAADFTDNNLRRTQTAAGTAEDGGSELRDRVSGVAGNGFDPALGTAAAAVAENSIGYVSYGSVVAPGTGIVSNVATLPTGPFGIARVQNRAGSFVLPLLGNVYAAGIGHTNLREHPVNRPGAGAYPITGLTWIMVEQDPVAGKPQVNSVQNPTVTFPALVARPAGHAEHADAIAQLRRNAVVVDFIRWAVVEGFGDAEARRLHMAPLTPGMKAEVNRLLGNIQVRTN